MDRRSFFSKAAVGAGAVGLGGVVSMANPTSEVRDLSTGEREYLLSYKGLGIPFPGTETRSHRFLMKFLDGDGKIIIAGMSAVKFEHIPIEQGPTGQQKIPQGFNGASFTGCNPWTGETGGTVLRADVHCILPLVAMHARRLEVDLFSGNGKVSHTIASQLSGLRRGNYGEILEGSSSAIFELDFNVTKVETTLPSESIAHLV